MGNALRRELRTHGWWIALAVASTVVLTVLLGVWLFPLYGLINIGGVWSVCHDLGPRRRRLQVALAVGAILLLPVGLLAPLFTKGGHTMAEAVSVNSDDEDTRAASARALGRSQSRGVF